MPYLEHIATVLEQAGIANRAPGGSLHFNYTPDEPDAAVILFETAALEGVRTHDTPGDVMERPRAQIRVRDADQEAARLKAGAAYNAVNVVINQKVDGVLYLQMHPLQPPQFLERDGNRRVVFVFTVEALKEVES